MPNTPIPPSSDSDRFDDWVIQLHRNTTNRKGWTPVLTAATPGNLAITYSAQSGEIFSAGGFYLATWTIATSSFTYTTASGSASITGLPTAANSDSGYVGIGGLEWGGITKASYTSWVPFISAGGTSIGFVGSGSGQAPAALAITDMPTGGSVVLRGFLIYR